MVSKPRRHYTQGGDSRNDHLQLPSKRRPRCSSALNSAISGLSHRRDWSDNRHDPPLSPPVWGIHHSRLTGDVWKSHFFIGFPCVTVAPVCPHLSILFQIASPP